MAKALNPLSRRVVLVGVPVLVFALCLLATVLVRNAEEANLAKGLQTEFAYRSRDALARIQTRLDAYEQALLDVRGLFVAHGDVDRKSFARFVENMNLGRRYPGIQGIGYTVRLSPAELDAHRSRIRAEGFPGYDVFPKGLRPVYTSIVYLEPFADRNLRAFGYDMYSEPVRRSALDRAADTGSPSLSGKVTLVQETETDIQAGFLLFVPVYRAGSSVETVVERRAALVGWVYAPFRIGDFMRGVLGEAEADLDLEVYDGTAAAAKALMFDRDALPATRSPIELQEHRSTLFGGHAWTIVTQALPGLRERHGQGSAPMILLLGFAVSLLAGLALFLLMRQMDQVQRQNRLLEVGVQERTERLASIIEGTNVGTWEWNVATGETVFSPRWAAMVGYTLEELAPVSIQTWLTLAHPDDLKTSGELLEEHFQGRSAYYDFESRMRHKDGSWVWVHDRGAVASRSPDGKPLMMRGTHSDITQKKRAQEALARSEKQFAALFSILPTGVVLTDDRGHIIEANTAAQEILGLSRSEALARTYDAPSWKLVRPDLTAMPIEEFASVRAMNERRPVIDVEMGIVRPDGSTRWLVTSAIPVPIEGLGVTIAFVDITARKQAEDLNRELESRNHQLQKRESLTLMAGSIAHHFNNRLQTVLNNLELAEREVGAPTTLRHLAQARSSTEGAADISRMLLVYLGQSILPHEPLSLAAWLTDHYEALGSGVNAKVRLECRVLTESRPVLANREELTHAVRLLIDNAQESMGESGGSLILSAGACTAGDIPDAYRFPVNAAEPVGRYAFLQVADTGTGIAESHLDRLFDPFFSTRDKDRGLGLSVVLGIVQSLGGLVTVTSRVGEGTSFCLYFAEAPEPQEEAASIPEASQGKGTKVLLVDDDELLLESAAELLDLLGFEVVVARDGVEALELYHKDPAGIGCVVTDLSMPRLDGWGLLEALRTNNPSLPVLMASGYDKAQALSGAHTSEPQAFLSKPFNLDQIRTELGRYITPGTRGA